MTVLACFVGLASFEACVPDATLEPPVPTLDCGTVTPELFIHCVSETDTHAQYADSVVVDPDGGAAGSIELPCAIGTTPPDLGDALNASFAARCETDEATSAFSRTLVLDAEAERICGGAKFGSDARVRPRWSFAVDLPERDEDWALTVDVWIELREFQKEHFYAVPCDLVAFGHASPFPVELGRVLDVQVPGGTTVPMEIDCHPLIDLSCFGYAGATIEDSHLGYTISATIVAR